MVPVVATRQFGVSTHLFQSERLCREHLTAIASQGFETVELAAAPLHLDYRNEKVVGDLQEWLASAGLTLHSVSAPMDQAEDALRIARRIAFSSLVVRIGSERAAARRTVEPIARAAEPLGVRIAVEAEASWATEPTASQSLVHFVEDDLADVGIGLCLDFGGAHIGGDLVDAIETVAEHLVTTHVHDSAGRTDRHLLPFEGTIDWAATLTAVQKIGYDGPLMLDIAPRGSIRDTLAQARKARAKLERMMI